MKAGGARAAALGAFLTAVVLFSPSLANRFAYDDLSIVVGHEALHDPSNLPSLLTEPYWPVEDGRELGLWRPLTTTVLALAWAAGDGAPWVFHAVNVLAHGVASALVALLAAGLFGVGAAWGAGLLFAVHPVHVEAVANVVGIGELLAAACVLGACVVVLGGPAGGRLGAARTAAVTALFALGLLAKEGAAVLPGLILVLDGVRERLRVSELATYLRRRAPLLLALAGVLGVVLATRYALLGAATRALPPLGAELLGEIPRVWTMAPVWLEYLRLLLWPVRLLPDYTPAVIPVRTTWGLAGAAGVVAALAILLASFIAVRRTTAAAPEPGRPPDAWALASAVLWFTLAILPASNLVFVTGILLAERSLYLPSAGLAMAVGVAGRALWTSRASALARPATLVALLVLAGRSVTYVPVWTDHASVFAHLAEAAPESGRSLWQQGDRLLDAGRSDQAVIVYRRAVPVLGSSHAFLLRVGRRLYQDGRPEHARALLARAAEVRPAHVGAPVLLAILETERGRWPEAERWARAILAVEVGRIEAWHMLATALAGQGRWMESARAREALLERGERGAWQQWYWLGEARALAGDPAGARAAADSARGRGADAGALQRLEAIADSVDAAPGDPLQSTGILQNPTPR